MLNFIGIDLEGVLVPEIWVALAEKTGIEELRLTTKDIGDYNELMKKRIAVLEKRNIKASILFETAKNIEPYEGAVEFLLKLRQKYQVIVLSDTFFNLSMPIFKKLYNPTVFCHELIINNKGMIDGFKICKENHKKFTLAFMNSLNFNTIAIGDSLNDIAMLEEANTGILFKSTAEIINRYNEFLICDDYDNLAKKIETVAT